MAQGIVNRVVPGSAFALGVVRSIVHGTFLVSILFTSFSALGSLPVTILRPTGAMKFVPWSFYDRLLTPSGMTILKVLLVLSLVFRKGWPHLVLSIASFFPIVAFLVLYYPVLR